MVDAHKLALANNWLDKAIRFDTQFEPTSALRYRMVTMALNKACILELEALGYHVYHHSFQGPECGAPYSLVKTTAHHHTIH